MEEDRDAVIEKLKKRISQLELDVINRTTERDDAHFALVALIKNVYPDF